MVAQITPLATYTAPTPEIPIHERFAYRVGEAFGGLRAAQHYPERIVADEDMYDVAVLDIGALGMPSVARFERWLFTHQYAAQVPIPADFSEADKGLLIEFTMGFRLGYERIITERQGQDIIAAFRNKDYEAMFLLAARDEYYGAYGYKQIARLILTDKLQMPAHRVDSLFIESWG